nr:hypothetical protein [uncultured Porphyromonas sp.]
MDILIIVAVSALLSVSLYELLAVVPRHQETQNELERKTEELSKLREERDQQEQELVELKREKARLVLWQMLAMTVLERLELDKTEEDKPEQGKSQEEE